MRDAGLRDIIRTMICKAVVRHKDAEHDAELDAAWHRHVEAGGDEEDWEPERLDRDAAW